MEGELVQVVQGQYGSKGCPLLVVKSAAGRSVAAEETHVGFKPLDATGPLLYDMAQSQEGAGELALACTMPEVRQAGKRHLEVGAVEAGSSTGGPRR